MRVCLACLLLLLLLPVSFAHPIVDSTQADAMLNLLERCRSGPVPKIGIQRVMQLPGTRLIIAQQNISRRITAEQYRAVLVAACKGEIARIQPSGFGTRAEKGVEGLMRDVGPSLIWGLNHTRLLKQRLTAASNDGQFNEIVPLAMENLPEKIALHPKLYFVMGGRAGAAASGEGIYIDLLCVAWRSRENDTPMTSQEMVEFFAHEAHHVGYGQILDKQKQQLHLTGHELQAWEFLSGLMMEGSATLFINAHGSWAELQTQKPIQPDIQRLPVLLGEAQEILLRTLNGRLSDQQYQAATGDFVGEAYHATGAWLLYTIEQVQGKAGVLKVMANPRMLLAVYNSCATRTNQSFRFDARLATQVERLGR